MPTNVGFSAPIDTNVWGTGYYYNFADLRAKLFFLITGKLYENGKE